MVTQTETSSSPDNSHHWDNIGQGDTPGGAKIKGGRYTAHVRGDFSGSASVSIQYASDNSDFTVIDSTNLTFTSEGVYNIEIANGYIKPVLTGGNGSTDIDVTLKAIPHG